MNVLSDYKEVLWDCIDDLGLENDEIAQAMSRAADSYGNGYFSLAKQDAGVGVCELTGQFGTLSQVTFTEH